jgi:hypothetical protein
MAWDEVVAKYPWVVIDPSSLLGNRTPRKLDELVNEPNPLWRQFYVSWMLKNHGATRTQQQLYGLLNDLNDMNKRSSDTAKRKKYDDAAEYLKAAGPLDEFYEAIREIKDAIRAKQKEDPKVNAGLLLATEATIKGLGTARPDETLINAAAALRSGKEKADLLHGVEDYMTHMSAFFTKMGAHEDSWNSVKEALERSVTAMRSREGQLREWLGNYQSVLPYLQETDVNERQKLIARAKSSGDNTLLKLYTDAEKGDLVKYVWASVSKYTQTLAAIGVDLANGNRLIVDIAKARAESDMYKNFSAAFPEAALGLMCAKTAVGAATAVAGFFPPIGSAVAGGLNVSMMIAEEATKLIMTKQAAKDPDTVIKMFGQTYDKMSSSEAKGLLEELGPELGAKAAELGHVAAELAHGAKEIKEALEPMTDVAREAAKQAAEHTGQIIAGVGVAVTVCVLAYDWYEFAEAQKRELRNKNGLSDNDVADLKKGLDEAWGKQASNEFYDIHTAQFVGMDGPDYKVIMNGIPGKIRRGTFVFSPDDRSDVHRRVLAQAGNANSGGIPYHGATVTALFDGAQVQSEPGESGALVVRTTVTKLTGEKYPATMEVSVEGRAKITGVDLPQTTNELARVASAYPTLSHNGETLTVQWDSARHIREHTWYFSCVVNARSAAGEHRRLELAVTRGGDVQVRDGSNADAAPNPVADVHVKTVAPDEGDHARVKGKLKALAATAGK